MDLVHAHTMVHNKFVYRTFFRSPAYGDDHADE